MAINVMVMVMATAIKINMDMDMATVMAMANNIMHQRKSLFGVGGYNKLQKKTREEI